MFRELVIFFVLGLATSRQIEDYRVLAETPKTCSTPGPFCETCSSLVACIKNPDATWSKTPLATCISPAHCINGACTTDYEPICWGVAAWTFPCPKVGIFPDPFYCNKFHICVKEGSSLKDYPNECEPGYGFNIASDICNIRLDGTECPAASYPVPLCSGTSGKENSNAFEQKPNMYYVCEQRTVGSITAYYPYINVCPGDFVYHQYQCGSPSKPTTTPQPTPPSQSTTPPPPPQPVS